MITIRKMAGLARHGRVALPFIVVSTGALGDTFVTGDVEFNFVPVGPGSVTPPDPLFSIRAGVAADGQLDIFNGLSGKVVEMNPQPDREFGEPFFIIGRNPPHIGTMTLNDATLMVVGSDDAVDGGIGGQVGRTTEGNLILSNGASLIVSNPDQGDPGTGGSGLGIGRSPGGDGYVELSAGSTVQLSGEESNIQIGRDGGVGEVNVTGGSQILVDDMGPVEPNGGATVTVGRSLSTDSSMTVVDDSRVDVSSVNHAARIFVAREASTGRLELLDGAGATVLHTGPVGVGDAGVVLGDGVGSVATMTVHNATLSVTSDNDAARIWLGRDDPATSGALSVSGVDAEITVMGGTTSSVTVGTEGHGMLTMGAQARLNVEGNGDLQVAREAGAIGVAELWGGAEVVIGALDGDVFVAADFSSFGFSEGGDGLLFVDGASLTLDASSGVNQSADLICGSPQSFVGSTGSPTATVAVTNGGAIHADLARIGTGCRLEGNSVVEAQVIADGGTVAPGTSIGTLMVADLLLDGGVLEIEVGGDGPGEADGVDVLGGADLAGGTILFKFVDGYLPERGDRVPFLFASAISGVETVAIDNEGVGPGLRLRLEIDDQSSLSFVAVNRARPIPVACQRTERPPSCDA